VNPFQPTEEEAMSAVLGSMLLSSDDPQRLCAFYADALGLESGRSPDGQYSFLNVGGFFVMFDHRDDVSGRTKEPGRAIFNIHVDDVPEAAARFEKAGATWLAPPEDRDGSWFATAIDPDGNYVQLMHVSEEERARMG
jgi:predicted enzyme related to lactoylglutathione lyase